MLNLPLANAIGIDVGGTNLRLGVFAGTQLILEKRFQADFAHICHHNDANVAWQKIVQMIGEAIQPLLHQHPTICSVGIGFPGFIQPISQLIMQSPNFPGLKAVNLAADLGALINKKVIVENDALAAAYGEYCLLEKPAQGLIYIGLGTGVGGGLILEGKPFAGKHGVAMEVGHIIVEPNGRECGCGNKGCMEKYASATGVAKSYYLATQQQLSAAEIASLATQGDQAALQAYQLAAKALAQSLAHVVKVLDVENIVIGGGMVGAWQLMQPTFNQYFEADLIPVLRGKITIATSNANDQAGMLGAAMLSM